MQRTNKNTALICNIVVLLLGTLAAMMLVGCSGKDMGRLLDKGISKELADFRHANYSKVTYDLDFCIPQHRDSAVYAKETITLELSQKADIIVDYSMPEYVQGTITVNGRQIKPVFRENHLVISAKYTKTGFNSVQISFRAGEQSLNRRDSFLYTLLVPARAHTLFPCFDQPDIKAQYRLGLDIPQGWTAVSNTAVESNDGGHVQFMPTEPLSSYLFAFVAGEFQKVSATRNGRSISLYHRETDPAKIAQCPAIMDLVFDSLEYLEHYTSFKYPFGKYELIAIPDFQYGGMEHTGATLYNDRKLFLGAAPTTAELLDRASLIAHETAHMWFGDCVTMKWFNDVWTKEVFANWFAAQMVRPQFPQINHKLGDLKSYYAPSYDEDRTAGSNAIQRPLDNLSNAGLIYCNIIYDKAPIAMDKLARKMGLDNFQAGIRRYIGDFAYSNATWDNLVSVLGPFASFGIESWSRVWIKEKGMPVYETRIDGNTVTINQRDPFENGNVWPQDIEYTIVGKDGHKETVTAIFDQSASVQLQASFEPMYCIPNTNADAYGCFVLEGGSAAYIRSIWERQDDTQRMSLLMTLYENVLRGNSDADSFVQWAAMQLSREKNPLILGSLLSYARTACQICVSTYAQDYCKVLRNVAMSINFPQERRILCMRDFMRMQNSEEWSNELYGIWKDRIPYKGLVMDETDYTNLAYQLMVRFPDRYRQIRDTQAARIENPDRKESFLFVSRAASGSADERQEMFQSLMSFENRRPESRALQALGLLCHPLRQQEAVSYITPALEILPQIQQTGDIFFPASWCRTLLENQWDAQAAACVQEFLDSHTQLNPLLRTKILQAAKNL